MNLTYAFKDYILNGLGADLVRISKILYYCSKINSTLHMLGDDNWKLVPENGKRKNWLYYFEETIPLDYEDKYPRILDPILKCAENTEITESDPFDCFSNILRSIYKPNAYIKQKVSNALDKFNFLDSSNYIAVHIRRGDKVAGPWREGSLIEIDEYCREIFAVLEKNPSVNYVYVATDSNNVIDEIKQKKFPPGVTIIYDTEEIRRDGFCYKLYSKQISDNETEDEIITFMKNMQLLVGAREIIGSRMSFFFIVAELLRNKKGISLSNNLYYPVKFY